VAFRTADSGWLLASCGIAGPVVFTAAWAASSLLQPGHSAGTVQLSGLAAMDARDPQLMMAGFVGLGACSVAFGAALRRVRAAGRAGPRLIMLAGAATVAAGVFRRDHLLLTGPGFTGESWHNQVHDLVSGVAYGAMIVAPLVLARAFRKDPDWAGLSRPLQVLALASAGALAVFGSGVVPPWNAVVQRAAVTLALAAEVLIAVRLLAVIRGPARLRCAAWRSLPRPALPRWSSTARPARPSCWCSRMGRAAGPAALTCWRRGRRD
jgi:Protein of unknown function (DUF998)